MNLRAQGKGHPCGVPPTLRVGPPSPITGRPVARWQTKRGTRRAGLIDRREETQRCRRSGLRPRHKVAPNNLFDQKTRSRAAVPASLTCFASRPNAPDCFECLRRVRATFPGPWRAFFVPTNTLPCISSKTGSWAVSWLLPEISSFSRRQPTDFGDSHPHIKLVYLLVYLFVY